MSFVERFYKSLQDAGLLRSRELPFGFLSFVFAPLLVRGDMQPGLEIGPGGHPGSLNVENYPIAPSVLQLEQVFMFIRHGALQQSSSTCYLSLCSGERTPMRIRMSGPPANLPSTWLLCKEGRKFEAAVASLTGSNMLRVERVVENKDGLLEPGEW